MTALVIADHFLVRARTGYHVGDLYLGDARSAYWYLGGFNPRGFVAWVAGMAPLLPGFARAIEGTASGSGWDRLYQMAYFYGFFAAGAVYVAAYWVWPQERQRGSGPFVLEECAEMVVVVDGVEAGSGSGSAGDEEKGFGGGGLDVAVVGKGLGKE